MTIRKLVYLKHFMQLLYNHYSLYLMALVISLFASQITHLDVPYDIINWSVLFLVPIIQYICREKIESPILLFVIHIVILIGFMFLPMHSILMRLFLIGVNIFYLVYSFDLAFTAKSKDMLIINPTVILSCCIIFIVGLNHFNASQYNTFFFIANFFMLSCYLLVLYLTKYVDFLMINADTAGNMPKLSIMQNGLEMTLGYTFVGMIIVFAIGGFDYLSGFLYFLGERLKQLLFSVLSFFLNHLGPEVTIPEEEMEFDLENLPIDENETLLIWKILDRITVAILIILAVIVLFRLLRGFIRNVAKAMSQRNNHEDYKTINSDNDIREHYVVDKKRKVQRGIFNLKTTEEKIRQQFKKRVLVDQYDLLDKNQTVEDLNRITTGDYMRKTNRDLAVRIYEKARYSNETCNNSDLLKMKEACK